MIILVMCMIFYTFFLSSSSSNVTCFQEWGCDQCGMRFNFKKNYEYHMKHCSGVNRYKCDDCGNVYNNKRTLQWHIVKQHGKDVCCLIFFVENLYYMNFSHILFRCAVDIFHNLHAHVLYYRKWHMTVMHVHQ